MRTVYDLLMFAIYPGFFGIAIVGALLLALAYAID
jgi:hypothetical protein